MRKLLTVLVLSVTSWSLAQPEVLNDSDTGEDEQNQTSQQVKSPEPPASSQVPDNKNETSVEVFRPSEEISEDLSVSFPVDI